MKKIRKIIFLSATLIPAVATTAVVATSCGKKADNKYRWADFEKAAKQETAINIYNATTPAAWAGATADQLSLGAFSSDDTQKSVSVDITRTFNVDQTSIGTFTITYLNNSKYDVKNWTNPKPPANNLTWGNFKAVALKETATNLLSAAKKAKNWKLLKWSVGDSTQLIWQDSAIAEFDNYGSSGTNDPYKGMAGSLSANDSSKTVSGIISIKGREGNYDANPIKVSITFASKSYDIQNWTFSIGTQLQSYMQFTALYNKTFKQVQSAKDDVTIWTKDISIHNWTVKNHSDSTTILQNETTNKVKTVDSILNVKSQTDESHQGGVPTAPQIGWTLTATFTMNVHNSDGTPGQYNFYMISSFLFANKTKDYGNCFSNTWTIVAEKPNII